MSIPMLQSLLSIAQLSPAISKWMSNKNIFQVSEKIIEIAKNITKARNESDAIARLKEDKNMLLLFQKAVLAAECEIDVAVIKDKESARTRDIAIIDSGRKNMRADIMVIAAAIGLFICLTAIVLYRNDLPGEAVGIISTIAGIFGSCLKDAYNFEFGSSRGSKEKDRTVAAMLNRRDV